MFVDYVNALCILIALVAVMILGSVLLKRMQHKFHKQELLKIEESLLIDTKRRAMIMSLCGKKYIYIVGPHNDHFAALENHSLEGHSEEKKFASIVTLDSKRA